MLQYGRRSKVSLLMSINVSGVWDQFKWYPWEAQFHPRFTKSLDLQPQRVHSVGWVARLLPGSLSTNLKMNSQTQRFNLRIVAIIRFIESLDIKLLHEKNRVIARNFFYNNVKDQILHVKHNPVIGHFLEQLPEQCQENDNPMITVTGTTGLLKLHLYITRMLVNHVLTGFKANEIIKALSLYDYDRFILNSDRHAGDVCVDLAILPHILAQRAYTTYLMQNMSTSTINKTFLLDIKQWVNTYCSNSSYNPLVRAISSLVRFSIHLFIENFESAAKELNKIVMWSAIMLRIYSQSDFADNIDALQSYLDYLSQVTRILEQYGIGRSIRDQIKTAFASTLCEELQDVQFFHIYLNIVLRREHSKYCTTRPLFKRQC